MATELMPFLNPLLAPLAARLDAAMQHGVLARRDPLTIRHWLLRVVCSLVIIDAPGELRTFLAEVLLPTLTP